MHLQRNIKSGDKFNQKSDSSGPLQFSKSLKQTDRTSRNYLTSEINAKENHVRQSKSSFTASITRKYSFTSSKPFSHKSFYSSFRSSKSSSKSSKSFSSKHTSSTATHKIDTSADKIKSEPPINTSSS